MKKLPLADGNSIPILGLGTYKLRGKICEETVSNALSMGYRHIDTARMYFNQRPIGRAIRRSSVPRSEIFLTSKLWPTGLSAKNLERRTNNLLRELQTDHLDLLLLHWPEKRMPLEEIVDAMNRLCDQGKVRSIGMSNFSKELLDRASEASDRPIAVNQVEFHPFLFQDKMLEYCNDRNIMIEGYCPLGRGRVLDSDLMKSIAESKGTTLSQIALSWSRKKGIVAIPKARTTEHLLSNIESLAIHLTDEEEKLIDDLKENHRVIYRRSKKFTLNPT